MDTDTFDPALLNESFRFIEWVNRSFGGTRVVWDFIREHAASLAPQRSLRILDIGSGSCDIPIALCRQAAEAGLALEITCVERNDHAAERARRHLAAEPSLPITLSREDIADHRPETPYDVAVASMVFHHFSDSDIVAMARQLKGFVRHRLFINDLGRCWANVLGAGLLTARFPQAVRHDAMLSVRRGFRPQDLEALLAALPGIQVQARWTWPFRVTAIVSYQQNDLSGEGQNDSAEHP